jgi:hypothetical protein
MYDILEIKCPYCNAEIRLDISREPWKENVNEIITVPLSVKLGQYNSNPNGVWEEISSLKGGLANEVVGLWNRTVGILRYPGKKIHIYYKELKCANKTCSAPFDAFISISSGRAIETAWPHLTGKVGKDGIYSHWPVRRRFEKFLELFHMPIWGESIITIIFCSFLAVLALIPHGRLNALNQPLIQDAILKIICSILVGFMITALRAMGQSLRKSRKPLLELIQVSSINGFTFWHNYMLARFTGVDLNADKSINAKKNRTGFPIVLTQADVLGGIPSVIFLLIMWVFVYLPGTNGISIAVVIDLIFWIFIAYFTGIAGWISMNFSVFMNENISLLPMKLTPLNGFLNIEPIKKIITLSLSIYIPIALLPILFMGAEFILPSQLLILERLLLPWFFISFAMALFLLGVGDRAMIIFGLAYVVMFSILTLFSPGLPTISSDRIIQVLFSLFWAALLAYQLHRAFTPIQQVLTRNKNEFIHALDMQLVDLTQKINSGASEIPKSEQDLLADAERILKLRDIAIKAKTSILNLPSALSIMSPILSSIIFPVLLDYINRTISGLFTP